MITELAKAIKERFDTSLELKTALSGGLYFDEAPASVEYPYGVYKIQLGDKLWFKEQYSKKIQSLLVTFTLYSLDGVSDLLGDLAKVYEDRDAFVISNYDLFDTELMDGFVDRDGQVWSVEAEFEFKVIYTGNEVKDLQTSGIWNFLGL